MTDDRTGTPRRIAAVGLAHHTADVAVRGGVAARARPRDVAAALGEGTGCVVLATCDRHEVWASAADDPAPRVVAALERLAGIPPAMLTVRRGRDAVRHLMRVTAGLDALVTGEHEVQGQVGHAWRQARSHGATDPVLDRLFQDALATAGRARAGTGLGRGRTSLASVAVELGLARAGSDVGSAVVVGVDPIARGVARRLAPAPGGRTAVLGPHGPAARLADAVGAMSPRGADAIAAVAAADLVVACAPP
ncbi:MAG: glutamyl-tRNA reductase, partial [Chloroflexota bacterium]